jgi:hypothetical protein
MKHIEIKKIPVDIINDYLDYKNLKINRIYSSNKSQIKRLDHYLWWFKMKNKRKSFIISKKKKFLFISTSDHIKSQNYKFIYSGLISCVEETNLFDFLTGIKLQNIYLDKQKNTFCFISIHKKNKVLLNHWKYFGYQPLKRNDKLYIQLKKYVNLNQNLHIFFKKVI